jgi:hypothetical protein
MSAALGWSLRLAPLAAVPVFAWAVARAWPALPAQMVVQFSLAGEPIAAMSRWLFAAQSCAVLSMPSLTLALLSRSPEARRRSMAGALSALAYGLSAGTFAVLWQIVQFNLHLGGPPAIGTAIVVAVVFAAIGLLLGAALGSRADR